MIVEHINDSCCRCKQCKHEIVKKSFLDSGCKLLSEVSLTGKLTYRCDCGDISTIRWQNFKRGERCRKCYIANMKKNNPKKLQVNQTTPMRYICECKNESLITWKSFKRGRRCEICAKNKIKNRFIPYGEFHCRWNPDREMVKLNKTIRKKAKYILRRSLLGRIKNDTTFKLLGYTLQIMKIGTKSSIQNGK